MPKRLPRRNAPAAASPPARAGGSKLTTIRAEPQLACISAVEAPVVVVGRYVGMPPGGAMQPLNAKLHDWLRVAIDQGIAGSLLGELFFVPVTGDELPAEVVVLAGMGEVGSFGPEELAYLVTNVVLAVTSLGYDHFAMVPIGTGNNGMSVSQAVEAVVDGAVDGLARRVRGRPRLTVTLATRLVAQLREMYAALSGMAAKLNPAKVVRLEFPGEPAWGGLKDYPSYERRPRPHEKQIEPVNRVIITQEVAPRRPRGREGPLVLSYAALTDRAVVPVRQRPVKSYLVDELIHQLPRPAGRTAQEQFGELLADYLLPEDVRQFIENGRPLTFLLDVTTARYPWEMACYKSFHPRDSSRRENFRRAWCYGTDLKLARQFRTTQSAAPGLAPQVNDHLEVLLIADPSPPSDFFPPLPAARAEARRVLAVVREALRKYPNRLEVFLTIRLGHPGDPDAAQTVKELAELAQGVHGLKADVAVCRPLELASLFISTPFDVIHFTGHGVYNPRDGRVGWVINPEYTLTADEVLKLRRVPRLVFANACQTATVIRRPESPAERLLFAGQVAGFVEAFFARGVENYLGAGWPIEDEAAALFAEAFYRALLEAEPSGTEQDPEPLMTISHATAVARRETRDQYPGDASWGAFQLYGSPHAVLAKLKAKKAPGDGRRRPGRRS
jgi:hypothetical protein